MPILSNVCSGSYQKVKGTAKKITSTIKKISGKAKKTIEVKRQEKQDRAKYYAEKAEKPLQEKADMKNATKFFGHTPDDKELNTWRKLVNEGIVDKIKELSFANYDTSEVKDSVTNLTKSDLSSDEILESLENYIKQQEEKEETLYEYVSREYGTQLPFE